MPQAAFPAAISSAKAAPQRKRRWSHGLIDRPVRPLFAEGWRCETQVIVTTLSHDLENDPDILAMIAASAALTLSGAPFMGPIGAARVGFINKEYVLNPQLDEMTESELDLVVAGTQDAVLMVESGSQGADRGPYARRSDVRPPALPASDRCRSSGWRKRRRRSRVTCRRRIARR